MTTIAEQFLTTEQAANALLDELENLKAETQHYSTASMALDAAGRSLSSLAGDTADLAARVRDLVLASREIGTERLLEGLDRLTTRGAEQKEKLQELDNLVRHALTQLQGQSDTLASSVNGLGLKLDGAAAATERRLQGLESATARLLQSVRMATWTALAVFAASLATLLYLLIGRH